MNDKLSDERRFDGGCSRGANFKAEPDGESESWIMETDEVSL